MTTPTVDLSGCEHSAFMLLMRAKKAMFQAGWTKSQVELFAMTARQPEVNVCAAEETPRELYLHVVATIRKNCTIAGLPPELSMAS